MLVSVWQIYFGALLLFLFFAATRWRVSRWRAQRPLGRLARAQVCSLARFARRRWLLNDLVGSSRAAAEFFLRATEYYLRAAVSHIARAIGRPASLR